MIKQIIQSTFIFIVCLAGCGQLKNEDKKPTVQASAFQIDTSVIAILTTDSILDWIFKDGKPTDLSLNELSQIESILHKCINDYNPNQERRFKEINDQHPEYKIYKQNFIIDLKRYKRQYVAIINNRGEKEVYINCFCDAMDKDWKTNLFIVRDGGNCYFNLKINLTTGRYYDFRVNGDA